MLFLNRWNKESASLVYFNNSKGKPAHTPDTPHVQPLSCKLEWTNQKHFYCFLLKPRAIIGLSWLLLKPVRDNLAPGFPRALDLSPLHGHKSSGSRLFYRLSNIKWRFFSLLFNFIHATFCRLYSWLILSVQKMIYFDLLYLSLAGSLGYIVCQHYESLFVLPIFDILFNMGARWFCLSCIRRDLISSASCVKR